jgi:hypothetical protein
MEMVMQEHRPLEPDEPQPSPFAAGIPPDLAEVSWSLRPAVEQKLGYFGTARFVAFHYQPQADAVVWEDGYSSGPASGASFTPMEEIAPLADLQRSLQSGGGCRNNVLLVDRLLRRAYATSLPDAQRLLARQSPLLPPG